MANGDTPGDKETTDKWERSSAEIELSAAPLSRGVGKALEGFLELALATAAVTFTP